MQSSIICIIIMALLPYLWVGLAKFGGANGFDNHDPRGALSKLTGWRNRAKNAEANQFESFPLFAAAVLYALYHGAPSHILNILSISIVILRIIYGLLYIFDKSSLRSLVWFIGLICIISIFFI